MRIGQSGSCDRETFLKDFGVQDKEKILLAESINLQIGKCFRPIVPMGHYNQVCRILIVLFTQQCFKLSSQYLVLYALQCFIFSSALCLVHSTLCLEHITLYLVVLSLSSALYLMVFYTQLYYLLSSALQMFFLTPSCVRGRGFESRQNGNELL